MDRRHSSRSTSALMLSIVALCLALCAFALILGIWLGNGFGGMYQNVTTNGCCCNNQPRLNQPKSKVNQVPSPGTLGLLTAGSIALFSMKKV